MQGEVVYGRDVVEPPAKPGLFGMTIMAALFPLVRLAPQRFLRGKDCMGADPEAAPMPVTGKMEFEYKSQQAAEVSKTAPEALLLWGLYALYWGIVLLGCVLQY